MEKGYCLVSQQLRDKIRRGDIKTENKNLNVDENGCFADRDLEKRVQPSSFEPVAGDSAFVMDIEQQAVFSPGYFESVYRTLMQLPRRQRVRVDISDGFELKIGFNYLIPLEGSIRLRKNERVKSSPKSSIGRLFPWTRMISDFSPSFDEIHFQHTGQREVKLWLLIQPTAFNLIINSGITLNQLRFFKGLNASLSQQEIFNEFRKNPLLYSRDGNGKLKNFNPIITDDGMQMNLDLSGRNTNGIVALRTRRNPSPINLSKTYFYDAEDFFEPIENRKRKIVLKGNERYLFASKGVLNIPAHLSAELRRHYGTGIRGTWDESGFADNGFRGDLVLEAVLNESGGITLDETDERAVSAMEFFRTIQNPDKIYGLNIGSNYQGQMGLRVSKHFRKFDFARAAKEYGKLNREVLVCDAGFLKSLRQSDSGFESVYKEHARDLVSRIQESGFFHSRYDCEEDEEVLQIIPYIVVFGSGEKVFSYKRARKIQDYGERKLFGDHSIGLGGHIIRADAPCFVERCLKRELDEEVQVKGALTKPKLAGTLLVYDKPVDRVHFGLIYTAHLNGNIKLKEASIISGEMRKFSKLFHEPQIYESWSRVLIPYLTLLNRV